MSAGVAREWYGQTTISERRFPIITYMNLKFGIMAGFTGKWGEAVETLEVKVSLQGASGE